MNTAAVFLFCFGCNALYGSTAGDVVGQQQQNGHGVRTATEPAQLQISIPIDASQLLQLVTSNPATWRHILAQMPAAARQSLVAQLRRGGALGQGHHLHGPKGGLRRSYSDSEGGRRGSRRRPSGRQRPPPRYQASPNHALPSHRQASSEVNRRSSTYGPPSKRSSSTDGPPSTYGPPSKRSSSTDGPPSSGQTRPSTTYAAPSEGYSGPLSKGHSGPLSSPLESQHSPMSPPDAIEPAPLDYPPSSDSFHAPVFTSKSSTSSPRYASLDSRHRSSSSSLPYTAASRGSTAAGAVPRTPRYSGVRGRPPAVTTHRPPPNSSSAPVGPYPNQERLEVDSYRVDSFFDDGDDFDHHQDSNWLRQVVPGVPGEDYPILKNIPQTRFSCSDRPEGYYTDVDTRCQVYHVCHSHLQMHSFLCPNGTLFSQWLTTCDWWFNANCSVDQPLPNSAFREVRRMEGYMLEDDWVADYEDIDAPEYKAPSNSYSSLPSSSYKSASLRSSYNTPQARNSYSSPPPRNSHSYPHRDPQHPRQPDSRSTGTRVASRDLEDDYGTPSGALRSSYQVLSAFSTTEPHRRPERPLVEQQTVERPPPSMETSRHYLPAGTKDPSTVQSDAFLAALRAPFNTREELENEMKAKSFTIHVTYGGSSDQRRVANELKFGLEATKDFQSKAQLRRWSFSDKHSVDRWLDTSKPIRAVNELDTSRWRSGRALTRASNNAFDYEIGRRFGPALAGSESRFQSRFAAPVVSRTTVVRPPPTRPMSRPAAVGELSSPETSVEPPTVVVDATNSGARSAALAAVQDGYHRNIPSRADRPDVLATTELGEQRHSTSRLSEHGRADGDRNNYYLDKRPLDGSDGSTDGGRDTLEPAYLDYDSLLEDKSFQEFGLRIPKRLTEVTEQQSTSQSFI